MLLDFCNSVLFNKYNDVFRTFYTLLELTTKTCEFYKTSFVHSYKLFRGDLCNLEGWKKPIYDFQGLK